MIRIFAFLFFLLIPFNVAHADSRLDMGAFARLPVLHEGRVKPADSLARADLRFLSGQEHIASMPAIDWLAELIFDPEAAASRPVFKINSKTLLAQMKLGPRKDGLYSFQEILPGLDFTKAQVSSLMSKDQNTLDSNQKNLVTFHEKALLFIKISGRNDFFLDAENHQDSWKKFKEYYHEKNGGKWNTEIKSLNEVISTKGGFVYRVKIQAELFYNAFKPWTIAQIFYVAAIIAASIFSFSRVSFLRAVFYVCFMVAMAVQFAAFSLRVFILSRPPVGSLYESLLFVSFIVPLIAFIGWCRFGDRAMLVGGAFVALFLLCVAPAFAPATDSLEVLVAVLNTNFWLATHVICIACAYALCVFTACLSHIALFQRGFSKFNSMGQIPFERRIDLFLIASLFFTSVGTALGGIWADQSWGRFWGWDPKENGALLIILWIVWILHGRWSGHIKPVAYLCLVSCLNVIVAFSWVGVNLLNTGLHSYGFTEGAALGLFLFCLVEGVMIGVMAFLIKFQQKQYKIST